MNKRVEAEFLQIGEGILTGREFSLLTRLKLASFFGIDQLPAVVSLGVQKVQNDAGNLGRWLNVPETSENLKYNQNPTINFPA